ncbi:hypothetical protein CTAM01_17250 [Colletotrichum tamarilloi]|uniref:Uncharacterized protein n=1 Tax=Colletotrichum tamarilloi TaxID=1209934 RepID=A0ABQ9QG59_9PEZI|nr:uncharacterized protein CTAM01_17250 [Colletotrichum tamarilloi]KAK1452821.1 hypothetical protein CTAM01_17250 [Colletotrichum tamarilloi]
MSDVSPSQYNVERHRATKEATLEARIKRQAARTPEYQAQVAKAEGNLQLINMILMSFSAEQNACVDQREEISQIFDLSTRYREQGTAEFSRCSRPWKSGC